LEPAEQAGLCEVVVRKNCKAGDIFKVFQDPKYRNRIAIFHYGGHANGYQLLLEVVMCHRIGEPLCWHNDRLQVVAELKKANVSAGEAHLVCNYTPRGPE